MQGTQVEDDERRRRQRAGREEPVLRVGRVRGCGDGGDPNVGIGDEWYWVDEWEGRGRCGLTLDGCGRQGKRDVERGEKDDVLGPVLGQGGGLALRHRTLVQQSNL